MTHRVVVTGLGAVTPIGATVAAFRAALREGRSGVGPITRFDPGTLPTRIAAEVRDFNPKDLAATAAAEALAAAGDDPARPARRGLSIGLGLEVFSMEELVRRKAGSPSQGPLAAPSETAAYALTRDHRFNAPPLIHLSACAASTDAIGSAFRAIRCGRLEVALAGGVDSMVNRMGVAGFCRIRALSSRNDAPDRASRPFDRERDGFVLGEGAAFLVLESEAHARARGATILAEISGYANNQDAYNIADPDPSGEPQVSCMRRAIQDAGLDAAAISAYCAHGTSTPKNDAVEAKCLRALFAPREIPVMAPKALLGHLIAAAGAVETVASVLALQDGALHPHPNLDEIAPECAGIGLSRAPQTLALRHVLKSSFALGGQNATLVISAPQT